MNQLPQGWRHGLFYKGPSTIYNMVPVGLARIGTSHRNPTSIFSYSSTREALGEFLGGSLYTNLYEPGTFVFPRSHTARNSNVVSTFGRL